MRRCHVESSCPASSAVSPTAAIAVATVAVTASPSAARLAPPRWVTLRQQVQALDAVGALVDRVEAVVAVVLFDVVLAWCSRTHRAPGWRGCWPQAPLRRPALRDRASARRAAGRPIRSLIGLGAGAGRSTSLAQYSSRAPCAPSTYGLLRQQHSLDVGVLDRSAPGGATGPCARRDGPAVRSLAYSSDLR